MPIIIDHTPGGTKMLSGFAQGYAQQVLQRQREAQGVADQQTLDASRTDNNIRQSQAASDYELAQAPARTAADVARARAMAPVALDAYKDRETFDQQTKQANDERVRQMREATFDKTFGEATKGGLPPHVQPWMVALARADFADGKLDTGTYNLLRPRTPREMADEKFLEAERAAKLRALERADNAPADAARFYRELRAAGGEAGPVDPQDEIIARGLESGGFKLNDPAVRQRLGLLTPSEQATQTRAENTGGSEGRLAQAELRRQIDAAPEVQAAKMELQSALRTLAAARGATRPSQTAIANAAKAAETAQQKYTNAALAVSQRLGMPGVLPPEPVADPVVVPATTQPAQPTKNQMDADRLLQSFMR